MLRMQKHELFHANELLGQLRACHHGDPELDARISRFMSWKSIMQVTGSLDHAYHLLKPNRQWGLRPAVPSLDTCGFLPEEGKTYWCAFTQANMGGNPNYRSLIWGYPSESMAVALAQVGMFCRIIEDAPL